MMKLLQSTESVTDIVKRYPELTPSNLEMIRHSRFQATKAATDQIRIQHLMTLDMRDEDGYPTDACLEIIERWDAFDPEGWLTFIEDQWYFHTWGWGKSIEKHEYRTDVNVTLYSISTAGWSGNEQIIRSMEKNSWLWHTVFKSHRRGGHYELEIMNEED